MNIIRIEYEWITCILNGNWKLSESFKFETRRSINSKSFGGISKWGVDDRVDSTNFEKRLLIE